MDWANLGRPCLPVPTFTNRQFLEAVPMLYYLLDPEYKDLSIKKRATLPEHFSGCR